jgi:nucleoid-associated protein YgaU
MKMIKLLNFLTIFSLILILPACSKKTKNDTEESTEVTNESAESSEVSDDLLDEGSESSEDLALDDDGGEDITLADSDQEIVLDDSSSEVIDTAETPSVASSMPNDGASMVDSNMSDSNLSGNSGSQNLLVAPTGEIKSYVVQKGDTYMRLAWKFYGDYTKWKMISNLNGGMQKLTVGTTITYNAPDKEFNWSPDGEPYLILLGDTLGKISGKVYGASNKWKKIWDNNRPLIKDPNLIFAGFTLYYLPDAGSVAYSNQ